MVKLVPVDRQNAAEILHLQVKEEQRAFVASNGQSLAEAETALAAGGRAFPFGIYAGEQAVGFLMVGFGTDEEWIDPPAVAHGNYSLWRLMIDEGYQHRGYGAAALQLALDWMRTLPCGPAEYCWVSYVPHNKGARELYKRFGFCETGEMTGGESIAVRKL